MWKERKIRGLLVHAHDLSGVRTYVRPLYWVSIHTVHATVDGADKTRPRTPLDLQRDSTFVLAACAREKWHRGQLANLKAQHIDTAWRAAAGKQ